MSQYPDQPTKLSEIDPERFYTVRQLELVVRDIIGVDVLRRALARRDLPGLRPRNTRKWLVLGKDFLDWFTST